MPGTPSPPRPEIVASWSRSRDAGIAPDGSGIRVLRREADRMRRTRLVRSLEAVLAEALRRYRDIDLALLGADTDGFIVAARACSAETEAWMAAQNLVVGVAVGEALAATNALGSVLETGREISIDQGEHYLLNQKRWAAAGVPIVDPKVRRTIGAFALICPSAPLGPLLLADARDLATQVGERLDDESHASDRAILEAFLRARRRRRLGVVGIGRHLLVADRQAQELVADISHAELWERAKEALADAEGPDPTYLTEHSVIRNPAAVSDSRGENGVVFEVAREVARGRRSKDPGAEESLDGLVGRSASWRALVRDVAALRQRRHSVLISGERGSGKASVAVAMASRADADGGVSLLDCAESFVIGLPAWLRKAGAELSRSDRTLVLRHLDLLDEAGAAALRTLLDDARAARVLGTIDAAAEHDGALGALAVQLGVGQIEVPPLRLRPDDVAPLATAIIYRHASRGYTPRLRPDTLATMRRYDWPGNVRELDTAIQSALSRRLVGDLRPDDLPQEVQCGRNIMLTTLQQREREAILGALRDNDHNKVAAANALGLARSTLYRKIEAYGIEPEG
jgi:transcriptional regulator of acetoin/glycerol metabolism